MLATRTRVTAALKELSRQMPAKTHGDVTAYTIVLGQRTWVDVFKGNKQGGQCYSRCQSVSLTARAMLPRSTERACVMPDGMVASRKRSNEAGVAALDCNASARMGWAEAEGDRGKVNIVAE